MVISKAEKCDKSGKSRKYPTFKNNLLRSQVVISWLYFLKWCCKCSCQLVSHFGFSLVKRSALGSILHLHFPAWRPTKEKAKPKWLLHISVKPKKAAAVKKIIKKCRMMHFFAEKKLLSTSNYLVWFTTFFWERRLKYEALPNNLFI